MLHTKFQGHRPFGSGEEDFFKVFTIYGHGGYLGHVTWTFWIFFRSPVPRKLDMKFGFNGSSGFRGEDVWKCWHTHIHIRTTEAYLYYKLINEPKGSGELKKIFCFNRLSNSHVRSNQKYSLVALFNQIGRSYDSISHNVCISYAVTAGSCYLLDLKNGAIRNH